MEKITGKEGKGVSGSGFTGETGSNGYSQLPRSSNAAFGIDEDIAVGVSEAATTPNSKGLNVGDSTGGEETPMSNSKFGIGDDIAGGTVPSRRGDDVVNAGGPAPTFGVSAKSGGAKMLNPDDYYGSGARKAGTAAQFGEPGRGGSMALAAKGLSGNTSGASPDLQKGTDSAEAALKSKGLAHKGIKGSGGPS
jgi:hypothetical protein